MIKRKDNFIGYLVKIEATFTDEVVIKDYDLTPEQAEEQAMQHFIESWDLVYAGDDTGEAKFFFDKVKIIAEPEEIEIDWS